MTDRLFKEADQAVVTGLVATAGSPQSVAVDLLAAAAYVTVGTAVAIAAQTTTMYEVNLEVSWPAHTVFADGSTPVAAALYARRLTVIVTRDASNGVVVVTDTGDSITGNVWTIGAGGFGGTRVLLRIVAEGGAPWGWKIEASRGTLAAEAAASATVTATIRTLSTAGWDSDATPEIAPNLKLSADVPQPIGTAAAGTNKYPAAGDHVHAMGAACTLINASGNCEVNATTNGTAVQGLSVTCDDLTAYMTGDCYIEPGLGFAVNAVSAVTLASTNDYCSINANGDIYLSTNTGLLYHRHMGNNVISETLAYNGASALEIAAGVTVFDDTWAQDGSAAGGTRTLRGQQGFAGFVGGDFIIGPGNGGTPGTNAPGNFRVKLGTPVLNVTGKLILEQEDATNILQVYRNGASSVLIRPGSLDSNSLCVGGSSGASGNAFVIIPAGYITMGVSSGYLLISSSTVYYESAIRKVHGASNKEEEIKRKTATVTTATSGNLDTYASVANSTISVEAEVLVRNNSDSLGVRVRITGGLYRNDAGTITTLVAATVNATEGDGTEAGNVTIGLSWSTNTLQLTYSFANAKNRKIYSKMEVRNGV